MGQRFTIKRDTIWKAPLLLIGVMDGRAHVEIENDAVSFCFGLSKGRIALGEIAAVERASWRMLYGIGVRIAPEDTLGFVGSTKNTVAMRLNAPHEFKVPFTMRFTRVAFSLEDPDGFIAALQARLNEAA